MVAWTKTLLSFGTKGNLVCEREFLVDFLLAVHCLMNVLSVPHNHSGFFDFYIIPLTQKLKDCGVFGVSSDELLHHAKKNREEWEAQGEAAVAEMIEDARRKYGTKGVAC